jgi:hypothetical protein
MKPSCVKFQFWNCKNAPCVLEHFVARNWYLTFLHAGAVPCAVLMQEDSIKASK